MTISTSTQLRIAKLYRLADFLGRELLGHEETLFGDQHTNEVFGTACCIVVEGTVGYLEARLALVATAQGQVSSVATHHETSKYLGKKLMRLNGEARSNPKKSTLHFNPSQQEMCQTSSQSELTVSYILLVTGYSPSRHPFLTLASTRNLVFHPFETCCGLVHSKFWQPLLRFLIK